KFTFAVWLTDYTDPDAVNRRKAARPKHLDRLKSSAENGTVKVGAVMVTPETVAEGPTGNPTMNGSVLIVVASSVEEVQKMLENDPYWDGNVWDKEKVDIRPI
ncbi:hypothetical protein FA95DRAFT_1479287, partial [Auriscalpium vulgare]